MSLNGYSNDAVLSYNQEYSYLRGINNEILILFLFNLVVNELFPGIDLSFSQLTIISLSQKEFNSEDVKGPGRKEVVTKKVGVLF